MPIMRSSDPFPENWTGSRVRNLQECGTPREGRVDNGSEFAGRDVEAWAYWKKVKLGFRIVSVRV
jgi:hypothetical protein